MTNRRLTKNEKKRLKKKQAKGLAESGHKSSGDNVEDPSSQVEAGESNTDEEVEYVIVAPTLDNSALLSLQEDYKNVMATFFTSDVPKGGEQANGSSSSGLTKDKSEMNGSMEGHKTYLTDNGDDVGISRRKLRESRMTVPQLKGMTRFPALVEAHDVNAADPVFLVALKATRGAVPVPRHWNAIRKYLQGKVGQERPLYYLPSFIDDTGIAKVRDAIMEAEKSVKAGDKTAKKPKQGRVDMDYQVLHDAFFKFQTRPQLTRHGDLYYEQKEKEGHSGATGGFKPGEMSDALHEALGMTTGVNLPPPWLTAMQRYGPPPGHPGLRIPGLNAPLPAGCNYGTQPGGWGRPPVDASGKPLYGNPFDKPEKAKLLGERSMGAVSEGHALVDLSVWGEFTTGGDTGDADEEEDWSTGNLQQEPQIVPDDRVEDREDDTTAVPKPDHSIPANLLMGTASVAALEETVTDLRKRKASGGHHDGSRTAVLDGAEQAAAEAEERKKAKRQKMSNFKF